MDNINCPVGLMGATGKGFIRTTLADSNTTADYISVDIRIDFMLLDASCKAVGR
jgi:hypothetical protein